MFLPLSVRRSYLICKFFIKILYKSRRTCKVLDIDTWQASDRRIISGSFSRNAYVKLRLFNIDSVEVQRCDAGGMPPWMDIRRFLCPGLLGDDRIDPKIRFSPNC